MQRHRNVAKRSIICEVPEGHQGRGADQNVGDIETRARLGPDGCGKTPHLGAIAGVPRHAVDGGRILFNGEDIPGISIDERARVGIEFTSRRSGGWCRGISSDPRADVDRLLGELDLEARADRDVNRGFTPQGGG